MYKQSPARAAIPPPNFPRRAMGMTASSVSAPIPLKRAQHTLPYWKTDDEASARAAERQFAAMSVGSGEDHSHFRNITGKEYGTANVNIRTEYELKRTTRHIGRKAARKSEIPTDDEDELSSDSSSESSDSDKSDDWETLPESDQESEPDKATGSGDESDSSVKIIEHRPMQPPVIEILDDTPPPSPALTPRRSPSPAAPPEEILTVIESLVVPTTCMQAQHRLPFLVRNLRRGFFNHCRVRGVPTDVEDNIPSVQVSFQLTNSEVPPHEAYISCYECPLCQLHLPFPTREMLRVHLDQDHGEVRTSWEEIDDQWRLELLFAREHPAFLPAHKSPSPLVEDFQALEINPEAPPSLFGPTARFPFLPAKSEYGGPDLKYSSRFGGPKIYDLLGTLPLEPYGVLAWSVLDREEEIFESDDIPDEHKVMHALWARWIFFNRNFFVANYFNGVKRFVEDYWRMIRLAAGWDALRYWILLLMTGRFLTTGREAADILRHYEALCKNDAQ
ncbi:hypothetical protein B0H11DRAFT_2054613 [Mycena galericulata]|nr:hypothetical protein B0H11DRAFT_2054613 [Mycena galericulata]